MPSKDIPHHWIQTRDVLKRVFWEEEGESEGEDEFEDFSEEEIIFSDDLLSSEDELSDVDAESIIDFVLLQNASDNEISTPLFDESTSNVSTPVLSDSSVTMLLLNSSSDEDGVSHMDEFPK